MGIKSNCCRAKVKVVGRTTLHYECCKCGKPCDYIATTRKTWVRSPVEKVLPNKKKYNRAKEKKYKSEEL